MHIFNDQQFLTIIFDFPFLFVLKLFIEIEIYVHCIR